MSTTPATTDWAPRFIRELAAGKSVQAACRAIGRGRSTVYDRRTIDAEFREAWENAQAAPSQQAEPAQAVVADEIPAPVRPPALYQHPRFGTTDNPTVLLSQFRFWGGRVTARPIGPDGRCPDCGWFVPEDRRWEHENRQDERVAQCPRQHSNVIRPRRGRDLNTPAFW